MLRRGLGGHRSKQRPDEAGPSNLNLAEDRETAGVAAGDY